MGSFLDERLAHPRRGGKPEFKQERCPPLDEASCSAFWILHGDCSYRGFLKKVSATNPMVETRAILHQISNSARLPARSDEGAPEHIATIAKMCAITNDGRPMIIGSIIISPPSHVPPSMCRKGNRSPIRTKILAQPIEQPPVGLFLGSWVAASLLTDFIAERLAHPRRGWKPEFKLERCPPLDGASCSAL
jgi:hypothetical protein